jgi:hypothetical protein
MNISSHYDYSFTAAERAQLHQLLLEIPVSPYTEHQAFLDLVDDLARNGAVPNRFVDFCEASMLRDFASQPLVTIGQAPIDDDLPLFDPTRPVESKYQLKATFVAEGFLALYGRLTGTEIIGHLSVNGGDLFHDIYPKESMYDTQSQKTLATLRFHRDFTNHFVSPDFVNTLTLRDTPKNEVYSTFTTVADAIRDLDDRTVELLHEARYYTPYDDVSTQETRVKLGRASDHAILRPEDGARVFEGRTVGLDEETQRALDAFVVALHRNKSARVSRPGDSVTFSNRHVLHGREVHGIKDLDSLKQRWLLKTHNVFSLGAYEEFFLTDRYGVVNG